MIRINLLPADVRATASRWSPARVISGTALALAIVLVPTTLSRYATRNRLQSEAKSLQSELDRYAPIIAQIESLENAKKQLQLRKSLIQQLEGERLRYPEFMTDFLKLMPGNIWLTNLATTQTTPDLLAVNMDVIALDNYAIADFVSNLEISQLFTDLELGTISVNTTPTGTSLTFHITANYRKSSSGSHVVQKS